MTIFAKNRERILEMEHYGSELTNEKGTECMKPESLVERMQHPEK